MRGNFIRRNEIVKNLFDKFEYQPFRLGDIPTENRIYFKTKLMGKNSQLIKTYEIKKIEKRGEYTRYQFVCDPNSKLLMTKKKNWLFTPDYTSGGFASTWLTIIVLMFTIALAWAIFAPMIDSTFNDLVNFYAYDNAALLSSKALVITFFDIFPYIFCFFILCWGVLASLKKEQDSYQR
jgi:hypothetical protein